MIFRLQTQKGITNTATHRITGVAGILQPLKAQLHMLRQMHHGSSVCSCCGYNGDRLQGSSSIQTAQPR